MNATQKTEVRVTATSAMVSILHMNQRVDSRNKLSAEVLVFRNLLNLCRNTSSFWNALMVTMPAMEEVMWWMTGAFSWLSSRLVSFTPWCIVQSITITIKMMATKARVNQGM